MTRFRIYPYNQHSRSAKTLAAALGGKVLRRTYVYKPGDVVINWGSTDDVASLFPSGALVLNPVINTNKLHFFQAASEGGICIPEFWTDKNSIPDEAFPVVCRTILNGHSGKGIVIADSREDLVDAPLYTRYVKKKHEYRIHWVKGDYCFIQRKARKLSHSNPDWRIRNLAGGFVYVEESEYDVPVGVLMEAGKVADYFQLDIGAIDIIWNEAEGQAYVLEINTACGLEERTAAAYAEALKEYVAVY